MSVSTPAGLRILRGAVLAGLCAVAALLLAILLRYPGGPQSATLAFVVLALGALGALALWTLLLATRPRSTSARQTLLLATRYGLIAGFLWILEISFNNLLPPALSVPLRDTVDNLFWLALSLLLLVGAFRAAQRNSRALSGLSFGLWSGFLSGLLACLMGLALVVFRMDLLVRDPFAQAEFVARGPSSGVTDLATYIARDTATGALGHLTVLGVFMGGMLGLIGSGVWWLIALIRGQRSRP